MTDVEKAEEEGEKQPLLKQTTTGAFTPRSTYSAFHTPRPEKARNACCGFFKQNATFGENFELAVRGALFAMPLAFPFFIPWKAMGLTDITHETKNHRAYFDSTAIVIYVFTLYKSVGETICFAIAGLLGTGLAVLNVWCMFGLFPLGITPGCSVWVHVIGWTWGLLFTIIILWLNFDILAKMFALSWHMYFWMTFLNPADHDFTHSFGLALDGPAFKALTMSALGCAVAILAACLPYPLLALNKARDSSKQLAAVLKDSWSRAVECYAGQSRSLMQEDRLKHNMAVLSNDMLSLSAHIDNAWWECFGFGHYQKARVYLKQLGRSLNESYNRLGTLMYSCNMESYGPRHEEMMRTFKPYLEDVCNEAGDLFELATSLAGVGHLDEDDKRKLAEKRNATKHAVQELSKIFKQDIVHEVAPYNVDEFAFCLNVCGYGTLAIDFSETLVGPREALKERPRVLHNIMKIFDCTIIISSSNLQWGFRNGLSILLSFIVGWHGYGAMINDYTSAPAGTVSLLLSTFIGSQVTKSMGRVQGVVLGCVFGQMAYALFAWCYWWGHVVIGLATVTWLLTTLFTYYNSAEYGYIGCLMAAFGTKYMLQGCSNETFMPTATYYTIINTVVGITLMTVCDLALTPTRTNKLASNALMEAWDMYTQAIDDIFDPSVTHVQFRHGPIMSKLAEASRLGDEAKKEPRYHRTPWRATLFDQAVKASLLIRMHLAVMEFVAAKNAKDGNSKSFIVKKLRDLKEFNLVKEDMDRKMGQIRLLFSIFDYESDGDPFATMDPFVNLSASRSNEQQHLEELLKEVTNSLGEQFLHSNRNPKIETLEDTMVCELSTMVNAIDAQLEEMSHLKHKILCTK